MEGSPDQIRSYSDAERRQERVEKAIRDTQALSETIREVVLDPERRNRLRQILIEVEFELQGEQ
jgi:hypothetical protein